MGNCSSVPPGSVDEFPAAPRRGADAGDAVVPASRIPAMSAALVRAQELLETQEFSKAFPYVRQAAIEGHVEAQVLLGLMYDEGMGVPAPSPEAALYWWNQAAAQRNPHATTKVEQNHNTQSSLQTDPTTSIGSVDSDAVSLAAAAAAGDSPAVAQLAVMRAAGRSRSSLDSLSL